MQQAIYLDNSWTVRHALTGDDLVTGVRGPATGLTVTAFLADTQTATSAIHPDLSITLNEIGATGEYIGSIGGDAISARLVDHVAQVVYEIVTDGDALRFVTPLRVRAVRSLA